MVTVVIELINLASGLDAPNGDTSYEAFSKMNRNMEALTNTVDNFVGASYENIDLSVEDALNRLEVSNTTKLDELKASNKLTLDTFIYNAEISLDSLESVAVERNLALAELQQDLAAAVESADINKQEILENISTTLSAASDTLSTNNTSQITQEILRLDTEVDSALASINTRMAAVENTANLTKQSLDNKVVESENRVVVLESNVTQLLSNVDTSIDLKLLNIQDQLDTRISKFNEDTAGILEGSLSENARKLLNPVLIQGISFDGSEDINLNTFSSNQDGLVPKTDNAVPGTYLDSTGAWVNPTESITDTLGKPNGIALLDGQGKVPSDQLPSYVDDVLEFDTLSVFPTPGETGKIYIDTTTNITYRWTGTTYVKITAGEVSSVNGRKGVVTLTKADVGLGNVDNTADADKNVLHASTADSLATAINIQGVPFTGATDIELPVFSTSTDGLVPKKVGSTTTKFLREDGTWVVPPDTKYTALTEALALEGIDADAHLITAALLKAAINKHAPIQTNIEGNAATATKLKNKVTINGVEFDGGSNIEISTGSSAFIGSVAWFNGNYMKMPDGFQQASGQVYNRADYPELWLAISTGQYESIADDVWLATPQQRGKYSTGDGSTTFRMPDLNGALADSIKAPVLRGDGGGVVATEPKTVGQMDTDAIRNITGTYRDGIRTPIYDILDGNTGAFTGTNQRSAYTTTTATTNYRGWDLEFNASLVVPTAPENRMNSVYGLWIVKVRNDTSSVGYTAPATLMHNEYNGNQIVNGDVIIRGNIVLKDTAGVRVDLPLGFIEWFNGKRTAIRLGTLPADGLLLNRADYPALWAEIDNGGFESVSETEWQATPSKRGCYSTGDGLTTFRLPDLNGIQTDSIKAPVLRGDGGGTVAGEAKTIGQMDTDAIREITGEFGMSGVGGIVLSNAYTSGAISKVGELLNERPGAMAAGSGGSYRLGIKASNVVPTAPENRMNSVYGIWIIRVNGGVPNTAAGTGATLESNTFNGSQKVVGDLEVSGSITGDIKALLNATGDAPISACRAKVRFISVSNVVTVVSSLNIASVERLGASRFKVSYTKPIVNNVPLVSGMSRVGASNSYFVYPEFEEITDTYCIIRNPNPGADYPIVTLGVF